MKLLYMQIRKFTTKLKCNVSVMLNDLMIRFERCTVDF